MDVILLSFKFKYVKLTYEGIAIYLGISLNFTRAMLKY